MQPIIVLCGSSTENKNDLLGRIATDPQIKILGLKFFVFVGQLVLWVFCC